MRFNHLKKMFILAAAISLVGLASLSPLKAQTTGGNTSGADLGGGDILTVLKEILARVNDLPAALVKLTAYIDNWTSPEDSDVALKLRGLFSPLGKFFVQNNASQLQSMGTMNTWLLNNDGNNVYNFNAGKNPTGNLATPTNLWYANDLVYSSLFGIPYTKETRMQQGSKNLVNPALNYAVNASGMNMYHMIPGNSWQGTTNAQIKYQSFYNTVMAATSFNSAVLSRLMLDTKQFTDLQNSLAAQASDDGWFAQVAAENIGRVLREILLYQSQSFLLLTEMVKLQKETLTAQIVNTATLIAVNQTNESLMLSNAQGRGPSM
jgi:hypothetical protein